MIRVMGVDTALRKTGIAVVEERGPDIRVIEFAVVRCPGTWLASRCLKTLQEEVEDRLSRFQLDAIALEGVFFCRNIQTVLRLGEARGAVMAAAARRSIPLFEYEPRRVKKAVVGWGGADKSQVARLIRARFGLDADPPEDAADALAIAVCHLQHRVAREIGAATGEI
jgi:crossover junction endodeoxyribonuclease RuvC